MSSVLKSIKNNLKNCGSLGAMQTVCEHLGYFLQGKCSEEQRQEAVHLLEIAEKKKEQSWEKDQKIAQKLRKLSLQAEQVQSFLDKRTNTDNKKNIEELFEAFSLLEKQAVGRSYFLDSVLEKCYRKICMCDFYFRFPEAFFLDLGSYEKNVAYMLKEMQTAFFSSSSTSHLQWIQLPRSLRQGIEDAAQDVLEQPFFSLTNQEKAYAVDVYFQDLQNLLHFCATFFYFPLEKAMYELHLLPIRIKKNIIHVEQETQNLGEKAVLYFNNIIYDQEH